jgi:hypothetical protein
MIRLFFLVLALAASLQGFVIINNCGAPEDYVKALDSYLQKAYDMYTQDIKTPALCPDFYVELRNDIQYPAVTYSKIGPLGTCAYKMEFRCDISRTWLQHLAFHEMAHVLQNAAGDGGKGYGWWSEAHAEGLASYYMVVRIYQVGQWQRYGYVQDFWDKQLYRQDPWQCVAPNLCAYQYGAFFAWLAWRYSPLNSTLTYALPMDRLRIAYVNFLLSPWSWGRDPVYLDFDTCNVQMSPNSGLYCTYSPVLPNRVYVFSSSLFINATGLSDKILLALVAVKTAMADPSVTVSYCDTSTATQTVTQTVTSTYTTTTTVTVPTTTTVTVSTTSTTTVPITTTVTTTSTATYTTPVTTTVTVTVPTTTTTTVTTTSTTTETVTSTVPTTTTETATKTVSVTATSTVTVPVTSTETVTASVTTTSTVTTTVTRNETVTTTVTEGGVPTTVLIIAVVAALLIGCYLCGKATAKTDIKTQEL